MVLWNKWLASRQRIDLAKYIESGGSIDGEGGKEARREIIASLNGIKTTAGRPRTVQADLLTFVNVKYLAHRYAGERADQINWAIEYLSKIEKSKPDTVKRRYLRGKQSISGVYGKDFSEELEKFLDYIGADAEDRLATGRGSAE